MRITATEKGTVKLSSILLESDSTKVPVIAPMMEHVGVIKNIPKKADTQKKAREPSILLHRFKGFLCLPSNLPTRLAVAYPNARLNSAG